MSKHRNRNSKLQLVLFALLPGAVLALGTALASSTEIEPFFIEPVTAHSSQYLPQRVVDALNTQGSLLFTYSNGLKMPVCEIFWVRAALGEDGVPASGTNPYRNLRQGALVGVIHFLEEASEDYREDSHDQKLNPGYYTMRYAVLPDSDTKDFVLLSPVSMDRDPEGMLPFDELARLSQVASRTSQPAVMSLVPVAITGNEFPAVKTDGDGSWTVQIKLHVKPRTGVSSRDIVLAIVVVTPKQEDGAS